MCLWIFVIKSLMILELIVTRNPILSFFFHGDFFTQNVILYAYEDELYLHIKFIKKMQ